MPLGLALLGGFAGRRFYSLERRLQRLQQLVVLGAVGLVAGVAAPILFTNRVCSFLHILYVNKTRNGSGSTCDYTPVIGLDPCFQNYFLKGLGHELFLLQAFVLNSFFSVL